MKYTIKALVSWLILAAINILIALIADTAFSDFVVLSGMSILILAQLYEMRDEIYTKERT